jgi:hypothetical protein
MAKEVDRFLTESFNDALKASRWIGWMYARAEQLDLWSLDKSRKLAKADVECRNHRPR